MSATKPVQLIDILSVDLTKKDLLLVTHTNVATREKTTEYLSVAEFLVHYPWFSNELEQIIREEN